MYVNVKIEKEKAEQLLTEKNGIWTVRKRIIKVELFYLPLFVFTVTLEDSKGNSHMETISVDGIRGEFAFFRETEYCQPENELTGKFSFSLTEMTARNIALGEYQRLLLKNNLRNSNISVIADLTGAVQVYYPYWIGYYKRKSGYDFDVIDAVGGGKQGIRMRPVFIDMILKTTNTLTNI
jgi:hypothetical protein